MEIFKFISCKAIDSFLINPYNRSKFKIQIEDEDKMMKKKDLI